MPSRCSGDPEATEEKAEAGRWAAAADDRQAGKAARWRAWERLAGLEAWVFVAGGRAL